MTPEDREEVERIASDKANTWAGFAFFLGVVVTTLFASIHNSNLSAEKARITALEAQVRELKQSKP